MVLSMMSDPALSSSDNTEILDHLSNLATAKGQPFSGVFELTKRCNLRCGMCYVCQPTSSAHKKELAPEEWIAIAKTTAERGMVFLQLSGGEIFSRPDFFSIYLPIYEMGFHIALLTNGTLINAHTAEVLSSHPPHSIDITVYGASEATYEKVTGSARAFQQCLRGIDHLLAAGLNCLQLKTTLTQQNYHESRQLSELAASRNLTMTQSWFLVQHRDEQNANLQSMRLSPEQVLEVEKTIPPAESKPAEACEEAFRCSAAKSSFCITPEGDLIPCSLMPSIRVNVLDCGFDQAWQQLRDMASQVQKSKSCNPGACPYFEECPWCPARAYIETGSYTDPSAVFCSIAASRFFEKQKHLHDR